MLLCLLKACARLGIKIFCRKVIINKPEWLKAEGPLLLACNHPNSFLDGIILTILFEENVYSLARGDVFRNSRFNNLLRWLNLLPVYRTSEGVENLEHNYTTFESCIEVFQKKGIVVMFTEGACVNEWHLRPLKKGTARLATTAWLRNVDLTVLPVGLNYNSFRNFGKNVFLNFGEPLSRETVLAHEADGRMFLSFNEQLQDQLQKLVYEIPKQDQALLKKKVYVSQPIIKRIMLAVPALIGFISHAPLYYSVKTINQKFFDNDHFDSTMVGILLLVYPIYLLVIFVAIAIVATWLSALLIWIIMPFCAWACVQLKKQM